MIQGSGMDLRFCIAEKVPNKADVAAGPLTAPGPDTSPINR